MSHPAGSVYKSVASEPATEPASQRTTKWNTGRIAPMRDRAAAELICVLAVLLLSSGRAFADTTDDRARLDELRVPLCMQTEPAAGDAAPR
jgi:hypothetical protein